MTWERKMEDLTISIVEYVGARRDMIDLYPYLDQHGIFVGYWHTLLDFANSILLQFWLLTFLLMLTLLIHSLSFLSSVS